MKIVGALIFICCLNARLFAQCDVSPHPKPIVDKFNGYSFLKSYPIDCGDGVDRNMEYSYVLTKKTKYLITLCDIGKTKDEFELTLFDSKRKLIAKKRVDRSKCSFQFECRKTGIYYIKYTLKGSTAFSGTSVLGFMR